MLGVLYTHHLMVGYQMNKGGAQNHVHITFERLRYNL